MTTEPKTRTITLTDASPVLVREDDWPVIALGRYTDHDGKIRCQANRTWSCAVRVRRHTDGRMVVHGVYDYSSAYQGERDFECRAGELLDADADVVDAIRRVGRTITDAAAEAGHDFAAHVAESVRDCIESLPAREI